MSFDTIYSQITENIHQNGNHEHDEINYDFHFVCVNPEDKNKKLVLSRFIMTNYDENFKNMAGQYISSMAYQAKHKIQDDLHFMIICSKKDTFTRIELQDYINVDFEYIQNKAHTIYEFHIFSEQVKDIFDDFENNLFHNYKDTKTHYTRELKAKSSNNSCELTLYMVINKEYFMRGEYLLNNPYFIIR
jgi:hypothetical protein